MKITYLHRIIQNLWIIFAGVIKVALIDVMDRVGSVSGNMICPLSYVFESFIALLCPSAEASPFIEKAWYPPPPLRGVPIEIRLYSMTT